MTAMVGQAGEQLTGIYEVGYRDFNRDTYLRSRETLNRLNSGMAPKSQVAAKTALAQPKLPAEGRAQIAHDTVDAERFRRPADKGRVIEVILLNAVQPGVIVRDRTIMGLV